MTVLLALLLFLQLFAFLLKRSPIDVLYLTKAVSFNSLILNTSILFASPLLLNSKTTSLPLNFRYLLVEIGVCHLFCQSWLRDTSTFVHGNFKSGRYIMNAMYICISS
jgi:hypothetical protein